MTQDAPDEDDVPSLDKIMSTTGWDNRVALARARRQKVLADRDTPRKKPRNPLRDGPPIPVAPVPPKPTIEVAEQPEIAPAAATAAIKPEQPQSRRGWLVALAVLLIAGLAFVFFPREQQPDIVAQAPESAPPASPVSEELAQPALPIATVATLTTPRPIDVIPLRPAPESAPALSRSAPRLGLSGGIASAPNVSFELRTALREPTADPHAAILVPATDAQMRRVVQPVAIPATYTDAPPQVSAPSNAAPQVAISQPMAGTLERLSLSRPFLAADTPGNARQPSAVLVATSLDTPVPQEAVRPPAPIGASSITGSIASEISDDVPNTPTPQEQSVSRSDTPRIETLAPDVSPQASIAPPDRPRRIGVSIRIMAPPSTANSRLESAREALLRFGTQDGGTQRIDFTVRQDHLRYYHNSDRAEAQELAAELGIEARNLTSVSTGPPPGEIEFWLSGRAPQPQPQRSQAAATTRQTPPAQQSEGTCVRRNGLTGTLVRVPIVNGRCQWQ